MWSARAESEARANLSNSESPNYLSGTSSGWWRGSVVERRSLAGELSLSCARPAADG